MPTAAAQILPALMGKTYLDVNKDSSCVYGSGRVLKSILPKACETKVFLGTKSDQITLKHNSSQIELGPPCVTSDYNHLRICS